MKTTASVRRIEGSVPVEIAGYGQVLVKEIEVEPTWNNSRKDYDQAPLSYLVTLTDGQDNLIGFNIDNSTFNDLPCVDCLK